ncbi:cell division protein ZapA [Sporosalibacterium faouarense]|uniref:cell division protein ZapA n=1 Tax=Sporosalibacterium faouarense TaxID=516123 RepID=UPI00141D4F48|nr:cell division protein ZapA [Sporosalibacterium faouarense]MTI49508.1 cell division protein ZapA [Bacillota bacterium]
MTERKKVVVKINGQEITVIGEESEEYIRHIADFVDEEIQGTQLKNKKLSQSMAATLAAFNIADKFYNAHVELTELKESVKEPLEELEELRVYAQSFQEEKAEITSTCAEYESELQELRKELEIKNKKLKKYEQALDIKEEEIEKSEKIISELQNKLFENQLELVQTKKELDEFLRTLDEEETTNTKKGIK